MKTEIGTSSRRAFLGLLTKAPLVPAALLAARPAVAAPLQTDRQVLMNNFVIAGFRYDDGPTELPRLTAGTKLTLRAEPGKPHDAFAVEVFYGDVKLGYVPRFCNRLISRPLLKGVPLTCAVENVDPQAPPWEAVAVRVALLSTGAPAGANPAAT